MARCRAGQGTDDVACWNTKTTNTLTICNNASPLRQWLQERSAMLRLYVHCVLVASLQSCMTNQYWELRMDGQTDRRLYLWNWRPISRKQGAVRGEQDTSNGNSFVSVEASLCSLGFWVSGLAVTNVSKLLCSFEIDLIVAVTMFIFRASRSSKSRLVFLLTHSLP